MKKLLCGLLLMAAVLCLFGGFALGEGENLLANGGFEKINSAGEPDGWYTSAYRTQEGFTRFEITDEKAYSGKYSAKITNANVNDARYVCAVNVKPETMYRVSGYILVDDMEDSGNGANLAIEDVYAFSECLFDTQGEWQYVEWYGETGEDQTQIQLDVRIGGYGAESQGIAYFDDITVEQVDTLPTGVVATLWYTVSYNADDSSTGADAAASPHKSTLLFVLLAAVFVLLAAIGGRGMLKNESLDKTKTSMTLLAFWLAMVAAFVLRLVLGANVEGYQVDMNCFSAWSLHMADAGPTGFYADGYFCDYPPGYMLLLWPVGALIRAIGYADSLQTRLLVKAVPILCDMVGAMALFAYVKKRIPLKAAAFVGLLFAFSPAALVNGAAWGQVDTLLALLLFFTAITAMERNWRAALPLYVAAALVKPQALLFAPVGGIWLILSLLATSKKDRAAQWKRLWQGMLIAVGVAAAVVVPFSISQSDPLWLVKLYQETLASYDYATLNTANLMYLLGGNWSHLSADGGNVVKSLSVWIPVVSGALLLAAGAWTAKLYRGPRAYLSRLTAVIERLRRKEGFDGDGKRALLTALCLLFGLAFLVLAIFPVTYQSYGTLWMVFAYLYALVYLVAGHNADKLPFAMALMLIGVYVLGLKVHERYLFAALLLLPLGYARTGDKRLLWLFAGFSVTTFLNTAIVLDNSILYGAAMGHLNADTYALNMTIGVLNVLLCVYAGIIAYTGLTAQPETAVEPKRVKPVRTDACYRNDLLSPRDARLRLTMKDFLIMGITFVVYSALTFTNLGSTKAPQTAWVATSADEEVVLELDRAQTFKILYYAGVSYNDFSVSVSDDGENWSIAYPCEMREGLCYRWNYAVTSNTDAGGNVTFNDNNEDDLLWLTGKYLRVNAETAGLNLWEIILRNADGEQIPLTLASHTGAKDVLKTDKPAENLIDEQNTMDGEPGWFYGTYFDEIYHARTAYEHLHGIAPYETTHPPLGKLIMSVGIAIFGMTPFGWRFMGALVGVLMLPSLYLLTKQLTKRRDLATFAMLLFTFDLMHFTQTRIATIDSFPVLFIILSFVYMARYLQTDVYAVPAYASANAKPRVITKAFLRALVPLALSGLFMGLSIASKWIGLYSAVGLAILFFIAAYRQFRTGLVAYDVEEEGLSPAQTLRVHWARELTLKRILVTCAFCVLFFIAVPAGIYYLSYIPYLSPTGPVTISRIVKAQISMFSYQSTPGLGMDHPFYSPWWQWPLILKPMWFDQDKFEPTGYASTIMCMGNPLIFYVGALCMVIVLALFIRKYLAIRSGLRLRQGDGNLTLLVIVVGFCAQYLPWVLVPRSMYIYHYFASVPFIILATTMVFDLLKHPKWRKRVMIAYVVLAAVFFAMFYPYASGLLTPTGWLEWLKWFPKLYY
ncbi:MAG: phospholipid carrier-dependent glycosyltransferase [Eubacteriales bacterium]|nr:phospholipid carrier-dependent glycosyltransferase [Eubacteriales bacterium]